MPETNNVHIINIGNLLGIILSVIFHFYSIFVIFFTLRQCPIITGTFCGTMLTAISLLLNIPSTSTAWKQIIEELAN